MDTATLLEQQQWLVPQIASLRLQLQQALKRERAERDARMKNIVAKERVLWEEKRQVAIALTSKPSHPQ